MGYRPKKGRKPVLDRYVPLCKFWHQSARDICSRAKIHIFPYRGLHCGATVPCYKILESCRRVDFNSNWHVTVLELFGFYREPKFGILGSHGSTAPKRGDFPSGTDVYHRAKFHADRCHCRRDICNRKQIVEKTFWLPISRPVKIFAPKWSSTIV